VAVIDQNLSVGRGGVLRDELASVLYDLNGQRPVLLSFVGGLGGRDIPPEEFYQMAEATRVAAETGQTPPPRLLFTEGELEQVRQAQAIAADEPSAPVRP
jgi:pyruvate ferredoxin oxidoreductase alpha subunit